jgi:tripartite-type tricarboxylate transporter receptor subunit TctC
VSESGLPGFEVESIDAIWMPARTPPAIVRRLNQEIVRVLNRPEVKARLLTMGIEAASSSSEELAALIRSETAKWGKLIREAGIRVN